MAKLHRACKAIHTTTFLGVPAKFTTQTPEKKRSRRHHFILEPAESSWSPSAVARAMVGFPLMRCCPDPHLHRRGTGLSGHPLGQSVWMAYHDVVHRGLWGSGCNKWHLPDQTATGLWQDGGRGSCSVCVPQRRALKHPTKLGCVLRHVRPWHTACQGGGASVDCWPTSLHCPLGPLGTELRQMPKDGYAVLNKFSQCYGELIQRVLCITVWVSTKTRKLE